MKPCRILMLSPEVTPFKKVGGLGDAVSALSKSLAARGHDVRVLMPKYTDMHDFDDAEPLEGPLIVRLGGQEAYGRLWRKNLPGSSAVCYFVEHNQYFGASDPYLGPSAKEGDNGERFTFFSRAGIDFCEHIDWIPDIVHCHDWTCALTPVYLNTTEVNRPMGRVASVFSIHNLEHQGRFHKSLLSFSGLPELTFRTDGLESMGDLNMLKGALYHSTKISTVSPTYAEEIQTSDGGHGLHTVLQFRASDLTGVLNGVDLEEWNPLKDPDIPQFFGVDDMAGKVLAKSALQEAYGLEVDPKIPLFTVVSRFAGQKGLDLLASIGDRLMTEMRIQVAILGSGDVLLEESFQSLNASYPLGFGSYTGFKNELAHLTIAGGDCFIMPSRFEPCGLAQMYAMIYGNVPLVRATGGLIDTVEQFQEGRGIGTGFVFDAPTGEALYDTISRACATYYNSFAEFEQIRKNGMFGDYSWDSSALKYEEIYTSAIEARSDTPS